MRAAGATALTATCWTGSASRGAVTKRVGKSLACDVSTPDAFGVPATIVVEAPTVRRTPSASETTAVNRRVLLTRASGGVVSSAAVVKGDDSDVEGANRFWLSLSVSEASVLNEASTTDSAKESAYANPPGRSGREAASSASSRNVPGAASARGRIVPVRSPGPGIVPPAAPTVIEPSAPTNCVMASVVSRPSAPRRVKVNSSPTTAEIRRRNEPSASARTWRFPACAG